MVATDDAPAGFLTTANSLTLFRLILAPAIGAFILREMWWAATGVFWLAVATDFADGAVARRRGQTTALGGVLDHTTDATFCTLALAALASLGTLPKVLPLLVALAFTQYALDSRVVQGQALRASRLGKWNGIAYYVAVAVPIIRDALGFGWPGPGLTMALAWGLVASTLLSMSDRLLALLRGRSG
jgi:CDP-diacylglycerol--glycerol-3-phosphate 3-phosphatidyltransferase